MCFGDIPRHHQRVEMFAVSDQMKMSSRENFSQHALRVMSNTAYVTHNKQSINLIRGSDVRLNWFHIAELGIIQGNFDWLFTISCCHRNAR